MANPIDPTSVTWDDATIDAASVQWDEPPTSDFSNVTSGVRTSAMTPAQASGDVPLPSDWSGNRPASAPTWRDQYERGQWGSGVFGAIADAPVTKAIADNPVVRGPQSWAHSAGAMSSTLLGMPAAALVDAARGDTAATDWMGRSIDYSRAREAELMPSPDAGLGERLVFSGSRMVPDLAAMYFTGGASELPAAVQGAATAGQAIRSGLANALEHSAKASLVPGAMHGAQTGVDVINAGGTAGRALTAAGTDFAANALVNAAPISAAGRVMSRAAQGAGSNVVADAAQAGLVNPTLPPDLQRPIFDPQQAPISALLGAGMGGALGARPEPGPLARMAASRKVDEVNAKRDQVADIFRRAGEDDGSIVWDDQPKTDPTRLDLSQQQPLAEEIPGLAQQRDADSQPGTSSRALAESPKPETDWRADLAAYPDLSDDTRASIGQRFEHAEQTLPVFDADMREIADSVGGKAIVAPLKGVGRASAKIVSDYSGDASRITDLVRGTIEMPSHEDAAVVLAKLREKYGEPVKEKNSLDPNQPPPFANGYRDINTVWRIDGEPVELQINVPEMLAAKKEAHPFYIEHAELKRKIESENRDPTPDERTELDRLDARQAAIYGPAWDAAMRRMNSSREITSASDRNSMPGTILPSGQERVDWRSSAANRPSGNTPNTALGENSGSEAARGSATASMGSTSGESVPRTPGQNPEWTAFPPESGTLGIPRAEMPQIKGEDRDAFVRFLADKGIGNEREEVPASSLKPTQAEFSPEKVARFAETGPIGGERSVLVSSDGYVLDGHHQWMAHREMGTDVPAIRLDAPIRELLAAANEFPNVKRSEGASAPSGMPDALRGARSEGGGIFIPGNVNAVRKALRNVGVGGILKQHGEGVLLRAKALADFEAWRAQGDGNDHSIEPALGRPGSPGAEDVRSDAGAGAAGEGGEPLRGLPSENASGAGYSEPAPTGADGALTSRPPDGARETHTPEGLRSELHRSSIGPALKALEGAGTLRIVDDPSQPWAGRWSGAKLELNSAHIVPGDGLGVALHEAIHRERDAGLRGMLGGAEFDRLQRQMDVIQREGGAAAEVLRAAEARIPGDTSGGHRTEERMAYFVEEATNRQKAGTLPARLGLLYRQAVAALKTAVFRSRLGPALEHAGLKLGADDFVALAKATVTRQARAQRMDAAAESVRYSMPRADLTADQLDALDSIGTSPKPNSLRDRIRELTAGWQKKAVQGIVDQFAPLKDLDETAYMQARLSKGTDGALEAAFLHGAPKLRDGALDIDADGKGLRGILAELGGEHDLFLAWIAGNRADALSKEWVVESKDGSTKRFRNEADARTAAAAEPGSKARPASRENLFTPKQIAALKALNQGKMADGRDRGSAYAKAHIEFRRYQKAVLDIAEEAGLVNPDSRKAWENEFYVPFYRQAEDSKDAAYGRTSNGLVKQKAIKELKGGKDPLGDLLANTLGNWSNLMTASMRNMAGVKSLAAAEKMGIARKLTAAEEGSVWVMENGKQVHYAVDDPLVLDALNALNYTGIKGWAMDAMRWFKHALTVGVTISPTFRVRNLIRDSLSVLAVSDDAGYNPFRNIAKGWSATKHGSDTGMRMLAGGGKVRFGSLLDGQQGRNAKRLIREKIADDGQILDTPEKLKAALGTAWRWWNEVGDRSETINRSAVYERARARGASHLEASYEARDLLDFTMSGKWQAVRFLTGVVPFLNARVQGLYKLGKGANQNPAKFGAVAGVVALASALIYLLQREDEDYKALPDWARDSYWCIKLGDQMLYIPKPFEVGAMGSVVERMTELAVGGDDYRAGDFAKTLTSIIGDQLSMNPIPQAIKPAYEAWSNYDSFRGAPIDSSGDEKLPAQDRRGPTTSAGAVAAGRATGISPKRIEHLARGYFGWIGTQALNASDWMMRDAMDLPSNPRRDLSKPDNLTIVGDFLKDAKANSDKYVNRYYDMLKKTDTAYAAFSVARKTGDDSRARELLESPEMAKRPLYEAANSTMTRISQQIKAVANDRKLDAHEKRVMLEELYARRAALAKQVDEKARAAR